MARMIRISHSRTYRINMMAELLNLLMVYSTLYNHSLKRVKYKQIKDKRKMVEVEVGLSWLIRNHYSYCKLDIDLKNSFVEK